SALVLTAMQGSAASRSHSKNIVVEPPSTVAGLAQAGGESMYLHNTGDGRTLLYLETEAGRAVVVLDVTTPAHIRPVAHFAVTARGPFDFVQDVGDSGALIRYRDGSGVALMDLTHSAAPVLVDEPALEHAGGAETVGRSGLLLTSDKTLAALANRAETYYVMDTEDIGRPALLATVPAVTQRVAKSDTGTIFLLNRDGITVVRRPAKEQAQTLAVNALY
ncbi:MAG: hypothetical protein WCA37_08905, partial [Terracidiphilus sp.]